MELADQIFDAKQEGCERILQLKDYKNLHEYINVSNGKKISVCKPTQKD